MRIVHRFFLRRCLRQNADVVPQLKVAYSQLCAFRPVSGEVETIALGSSHAHYGFSASATTRSFNFANTSLDLRTAAGVYSHVEKTWNAPCGNVVLFYDVFSEGFQLERTSEAFRCIPYDALYGIRTEFKDRKLRKVADRLRWCRDALSFHVEADYRGNSDYGWFFPPDTDVEARVRGHLKNSMRGSRQSRFLDDIAGLAKVRNRRFFVVLPPYRSDYAACLKGETGWRRGLDDFLARHGDVRLLDFGSDRDFVEGDFGDSDHLNQRGGAKLTAKIVKEVESGIRLKETISY